MTQTSRQSAKIYQLSAARAKLQDPIRKQSDTGPRTGALPLVSGEYGNGWYHDAAIAEEARLRKV